MNIGELKNALESWHALAEVWIMHRGHLVPMVATRTFGPDSKGNDGLLLLTRPQREGEPIRNPLSWAQHVESCEICQQGMMSRCNLGRTIGSPVIFKKPPVVGMSENPARLIPVCTCSYDESEEMTRHAALCSITVAGEI